MSPRRICQRDTNLSKICPPFQAMNIMSCWLDAACIGCKMVSQVDDYNFTYDMCTITLIIIAENDANTFRVCSNFS